MVILCPGAHGVCSTGGLEEGGSIIGNKNLNITVNVNIIGKSGLFQMIHVVFYLISLMIFGLPSYKAIQKKPYTVRYMCNSKRAHVIQVFFSLCQKLIPFLSTRLPHIVKKAFAREKAFCVTHFAKINSLNYKHGRQDPPQVIQFTYGISCLERKCNLQDENCMSSTCRSQRMQHVRDAFPVVPTTVNLQR